MEWKFLHLTLVTRNRKDSQRITDLQLHKAASQLIVVHVELYRNQPEVATLSTARSSYVILLKKI
jgi:hypothetical protein